MERSKKFAFSLAELMITLLILSIVLSAVMPAVTKRNAGQESVWRWLYDGSHAYFGTGPKQEALIGMAVKPKIDGATVADYTNRDKNGDSSTQFTLTDNGDRLLIMKYTYKDPTDSSKKFHPMSNSHITFFSTTDDGTNEIPHYAGRLAMDETNIALGKYTMARVQTPTSSDGDYNKKNNIALGQYSLHGLVTGYNNVAIGNETLYSNGAGYNNVALGYQALVWNESGYENNALGYQALFSSTSSRNNNAVGHQAGYGIIAGNFNTLVGNFSMKMAASRDTSTANGDSNTVVGHGALYAGASSFRNTVVGALSGNSNNFGDDNAFLGAWSGFLNTSGSFNTMLGSMAGYTNGKSSYNIFLGHKAGYSNSGDDASNNMFLGSLAGFSNTAGSNNIFIGSMTGYTNSEGANNTFLGYQAGYTNETGSNNVFIGYKAGFDSTESNKFIISNGRELMNGQFPTSDSDPESLLTTLAYTTHIKSHTTNIGINDSDEVTLAIDSANGIIAFGGKLTGAAGNDLLISGNLAGDGGALTLNSNLNMNGKNIVNAGTINGQPYPPSDRRLKNVLGDAEQGLSAVDAFKIVRYNYKNDETKIEHVGLIAQDLQKILPNAVVKMENGFLSISISDILFTVTKAVQELHQAVLDIAKEVKSLAARVTTNAQKIEALEKENASLKQQINDLDARLKKLEETK